MQNNRLFITFCLVGVTTLGALAGCGLKGPLVKPGSHPPVTSPAPASAP